MKRLISLLLVLSIYTSGYCQLEGIRDTLKSINKKIDTIDEKLSSLSKNSSTSGTVLSTIDSASLAYFKAHPDTIYPAKNKLFFTKGDKQRPASVKLRYVIMNVVLWTFVIASFWLLLFTNLCRDVIYNTAGEVRVFRPSIGKNRFSLTKVILWWWTLIIGTCFIYMYAVSGIMVPITPAMLILLGIAAGTRIVGSAIDTAQIKAMTGLRFQDGTKSRGLFADINSDESNFTINRFQAVLFNFVFGLSFFFFFFNQIKIQGFPYADFAEWQLILLGISSTGFLAMKATNENRFSTPITTQNNDTVPAGDVRVTLGGLKLD